MTVSRLIADRYRLAEKIGHGGMGQVWAGHDERLGRRVAVKLLRTDLLNSTDGTGADATASRSDELRRRFLRECRVTAALDHPGLVTVFDAGEDGGELYLVMQRVPGLSLADLIAEQEPFPIVWAVAVAAQLCTALAAVHAVPVVHRDLKPSNVMVREDGRVVLLDLGIATALDTDATRLTLTGVPIGSPAYMAPEQALAGTADPRSDLYALGCLLHEMLAGEAPFRAPTALGVLRRHVDEPPAALRTLRPEVPAVLETLVLDLLAKRPEDRPADAGQVYARLLPLLPAAGAELQPPVGPLPDPTRPYRYPHQPHQSHRPQSAAVPAPAAPVDDLTGAFAELSDLVAARRYAEVTELAGRLLPRARVQLGDAAPLVQTVRTIYARTLREQRRYREALAEYRQLLADAGADPERSFELREQIGLLRVQLGDREGAWQWLLELLLERERSHGPHHPDVLRLRTHLNGLGSATPPPTPVRGNPYANS
ncbi:MULTISPECIES: serine/threonine-protein kinase [unclassified Kitasatospora]|uniref:serine/threonine-protein kinase n=1 Tax=unclassified Kitasatospora TaxID=2633591 RepID=UPI0007C77416|nr:MULTISPECIES: serine/threonine-protein kinase [unclassified Kitasatospora]